MNQNKDEKSLIRRIADACNQRGHATFFHGPRDTQAFSEKDAVHQWAREINKTEAREITSIQTNPDVYPDCIATERGRKIGIEVTELVEKCAIAEFQRTRYVPYVDWTVEKLKKDLSAILANKDVRTRVRDFDEQILLIITDEPDLTLEKAQRHLAQIKLNRPKNFDSVYLMQSYHSGVYPVHRLI